MNPVFRLLSFCDEDAMLFFSPYRGMILDNARGLRRVTPCPNDRELIDLHLMLDESRLDRSQRLGADTPTPFTARSWWKPVNQVVGASFQ